MSRNTAALERSRWRGGPTTASAGNRLTRGNGAVTDRLFAHRHCDPPRTRPLQCLELMAQCQEISAAGARAPHGRNSAAASGARAHRGKLRPTGATAEQQYYRFWHPIEICTGWTACPFQSEQPPRRATLKPPASRPNGDRVKFGLTAARCGRSISMAVPGTVNAKAFGHVSSPIRTLRSFTRAASTRLRSDARRELPRSGVLGTFKARREYGSAPSTCTRAPCGFAGVADAVQGEGGTRPVDCLVGRRPVQEFDRRPLGYRGLGPTQLHACGDAWRRVQ